jgi:hypothetical protein
MIMITCDQYLEEYSVGVKWLTAGHVTGVIFPNGARIPSSVPNLNLFLKGSLSILFSGHQSRCPKTKQIEREVHFYLRPRSREKGGVLSPFPYVFSLLADQVQGKLNASPQQDDCGDNVSEMYQGADRFESRLGYRLYHGMFFVVFFSPFKQTLG